MKGPAAAAAVLLLLVLVVAAAAHAAAGAGEREEDPEVVACKQQCAAQRRFGEPETRYCAARCEDYGREKERRQEEEEEKQSHDPEKERDRCLHECRVGPSSREKKKPGCERRCLEEYERATRGGDGPTGRPGRYE